MVCAEWFKRDHWPDIVLPERADFLDPKVPFFFRAVVVFNDVAVPLESFPLASGREAMN